MVMQSRSERVAVVMAVMSRPSLWPVAVRQVFRLAPNGWWRKRPFLPVPAAPYLRFRLETQYGTPAGEPEAPRASDVVNYLRWCRDWERTNGR
jgi:hypothetical protein